MSVHKTDDVDGENREAELAALKNIHVPDEKYLKLSVSLLSCLFSPLNLLHQLFVLR